MYYGNVVKPPFGMYTKAILNGGLPAEAAAPAVAADTLVVVTRNGGVYGFRPD